jgi:hypothetical protein
MVKKKLNELLKLWISNILFFNYYFFQYLLFILKKSYRYNLIK